MWTLIFEFGWFFIKLFSFNSKKKAERRKDWISFINKSAKRTVIAAEGFDDYKNQYDNFDKEPDSNN